MNDRTPEGARADELLALRCQLGEPAAYDELIRRWAAPLRRYVLRMTDDSSVADDLMQEIWLAVLQGIGRLRDGSKLRSWLFGIAHRKVMDRLRARYVDPVDPDAELAESGAEDPFLDRAEARRAVERGLAFLPVPEREVLTLFYLQELSLGEIAGALFVPVGTIKSRLFRARGMLRDQLLADPENLR